jgi:hypothetical protein
VVTTENRILFVPQPPTDEAAQSILQHEDTIFLAWNGVDTRASHYNLLRMTSIHQTLDIAMATVDDYVGSWSDIKLTCVTRGANGLFIKGETALARAMMTVDNKSSLETAVGFRKEATFFNGKYKLAQIGGEGGNKAGTLSAVGKQEDGLAVVRLMRMVHANGSKKKSNQTVSEEKKHNCIKLIRAVGGEWANPFWVLVEGQEGQKKNRRRK